MAKKRKTKSNEKKNVVVVATVTATLVCTAKRMRELLHSRFGFTAIALGREEKKAIAEELKGVYKEHIEKHYIPNSKLLLILLGNTHCFFGRNTFNYR